VCTHSTTRTARFPSLSLLPCLDLTSFGGVFGFEAFEKKGRGPRKYKEGES
jgi:hypothetical protein